MSMAIGSEAQGLASHWTTAAPPKMVWQGVRPGSFGTWEILLSPKSVRPKSELKVRTSRKIGLQKTRKTVSVRWPDVLYWGGTCRKGVIIPLICEVLWTPPVQVPWLACAVPEELDRAQSRGSRERLFPSESQCCSLHQQCIPWLQRAQRVCWLPKENQPQGDPQQVACDPPLIGFSWCLKSL